MAETAVRGRIIWIDANRKLVRIGRFRPLAIVNQLVGLIDQNGRTAFRSALSLTAFLTKAKVWGKQD